MSLILLVWVFYPKNLDAELFLHLLQYLPVFCLRADVIPFEMPSERLPFGRLISYSLQRCSDKRCEPQLLSFSAPSLSSALARISVELFELITPTFEISTAGFLIRQSC
jgi:hypothetical protein